jgi:hypothetical protein
MICWNETLSSQEETMAAPVQKASPPLAADEILVAEFNYIEKTVFQANEDRARVSSYYLSAAGSLIAVILGLQLKESGKLDSQVCYGFSLLFVILGFTGWLTLLQLVRLRRAWRDSVCALSRIKEYYLQHCQETDLGQAFLWRTETIPASYKPSSISFLLALQVSAMSGVMFGASYFCLAKAQQSTHWLVSLLIGLALMILQMAVYRSKLKKD